MKAAKIGTLKAWVQLCEQGICTGFRISKPTLKPEGSVKPRKHTPKSWRDLKLKELQPWARPLFRAFLLEAEKIAAKHGVELMVWDARRSLPRQLELYRRGRTKKGKKVTWTIASFHLFGLAIDLIIWKYGPGEGGRPEGRPCWDLPKWWTKEILPLAKKHGLESLYLKTGKDRPHIQYPEKKAPRSVALWREDLKKGFLPLWRQERARPRPKKPRPGSDLS